MKVPKIYNNKKQVNYSGPGLFKQLPRCYWRVGTKRKCPRVIVKCGCCNNKFNVYYGITENDDSVEINGVMMSWKWLDGFIELLKVKGGNYGRKATKQIV